MSYQNEAAAVLYPRRKDPLYLSTGWEAEWAPEPVWTQRLEGKSLALI
jgi:hypothetical protein